MMATQRDDLAQRMIDGLDVLCVVLDEQGAICMENKAWRQAWQRQGGAADYEWRGRSYFSGWDEPEIIEEVQRALRGEAAATRLEYPCDRPDGSTDWFVMHAGHLASGGAIVTHVDVTANKEAQRALSDQATHDPLTGVFNRRGLEPCLQRHLSTSGREGESLHALFIDCDDFKVINDSIGHLGGDAVLREATIRMNSVLRSEDSLGRVGGDEFLAFLPATREAEAMVVAERLRDVIAARRVAHANGSVRVSVSAAVVRCEPSMRSISDVLEAAEEALRRSKRGGKNRVSVIDELQAGAIEAAAAAMRDASFFRANAAPIVDLGTGRVVAQEYRARGQGAYVRPSDFFRLAKERESLTRVDLAALRACALASEGSAVEPRFFVLPTTLLTKGAESIVRCLPRREGCWVQLSEQQISGDPTALRAPTRELKELGVRVALTNVGFGRSSLESLVLLEPDGITLDRSLVGEAARDRSQRSALERFVRVAGALRADVAADGLSSALQKDVAKASGVRLGQGPLVGRRRPAESGVRSMHPTAVDRVAVGKG